MTDTPSMAELWDTADGAGVSEDEYWNRWETVRLVLETGGRVITREEVATWRPRPEMKIETEYLLYAGHLESVPADLERLCQGLHPLDPDGEWARYHAQRHRGH